MRIKKRKSIALVLSLLLLFACFMQTTERALAKQQSELPKKYDGRVEHTLPSAMNQGATGICWAYAIVQQMNYARLQTNRNAVLCGDETAELFSKAFYTGNPALQGEVVGDKNISLESDVPLSDKSGNPLYATFFSAAAPDIMGQSLRKGLWIPITDVPSIKKAVVQYGMVAISYYEAENYFNENTNAYYNDTVDFSNHTVNIVGWDDNYEKENFSVKPETNGAWLVQNSYGTEYGEDGFFWLSYEDVTLQNENQYGYVFDFFDKNVYDKVYQYDGSSSVFMDAMNEPTTEKDYTVLSGGYIANVFTVPPNSGKQNLQAVSFALFDTDVAYEIEIYKQDKSNTNPISGKRILKRPIKGKTSYKGYYTVDIAEQPLIKEGEKYAVVIRLAKRDKTAVHFLADETCQGDYWIAFKNATKKGQSFRSNDGVLWQDMHEIDHAGDGDGMSIRIKAFSSEKKEEQEREQEKEQGSQHIISSDEKTYGDSQNIKSPKTGEE